MFIKTIFLTKTWSNNSQTGISLEGNGGHAWFQWNVTLASLTWISVLWTDSNGKIIASAWVAGWDSLWTQAGGHIYNNNHATGNVGIGITLPTQALQVSGNILWWAPNNSITQKYSSLVGGAYNTLKWTMGFIWWGVANSISDSWYTELDLSWSDVDTGYFGMNSSGLSIVSWFNVVVWWMKNTLTGMAWFIWWGGMNGVYGVASNIVGWMVNYIDGMASNIVGWMQNQINTWDYSSILWWKDNRVWDIISGSASYTSIVWWENNAIVSGYGFIGWWMNNYAQWVFSSLVWWENNLLWSTYWFIGWWLNNNVWWSFSVIVWWSWNATTKGSYNFVWWGEENGMSLNYNSIVWGLKNWISWYYSFIWWGSGNHIDGDYASIVWWNKNTIQQNATYGFIWWGSGNNVQQNAKYGLIWWGDGNNVKSDYSTIVWWKKNIIDSTGSYWFIWWGSGNLIEGKYGSIVWWISNSISRYSTHWFVWWWIANQLLGTETSSSILGGSGNYMNSGFGKSNSILGGEGNAINSKTSSQYSVVAWWFTNRIAGETVIASFAAGYKSRVTNTNTFVWNSSTDSFESDQDYTFLINAPYSGWIENVGWVGINLNAPTAALDVNGSIKTNEYLIVNSWWVDYTGINKTIDIQLSGWTSTCTLIFVKWLLTSTSCP